MKCVILAGGSGLRLWPLSRQKYPKQFLSLTAQSTMFQETVQRNQGFADSMMVLTNAEFQFIVQHQMEEMAYDTYQLLLEEVGRNTAAAITLASLCSKPEEVLFVVPADAKIEAGEAYTAAVNKALEFAQSGNIVTFGIAPKSPHTGYGYIQYQGYDVVHFKEKPQLEVAKSYLDSGDYLWNSGMFMFQAKTLLSEMAKYQPEILERCTELVNALAQNQVASLPEALMRKIPSVSIDVALMEKTALIKVVPSHFQWNDIGGLEALADESGTPENTILDGCHNVDVINNVDNQLIVGNELENLIVVNTNDAIYISKNGTSANIKNIMEKHDGYKKYFESDIYGYRPWGFYEVLIDVPGYKVKKLSIYPGKRLSLQTHQFRSEHWVVVQGTATITLGNHVGQYSANESTYIPVGELHRLANETTEALTVIEIALGDVIDESDIVRYADDFQREIG